MVLQVVCIVSTDLLKGWPQNRMKLSGIYCVDLPFIPVTCWVWGWVSPVTILVIIMRNMATSVLWMNLSHPVHRIWYYWKQSSSFHVLILHVCGLCCCFHVCVHPYIFDVELLNNWTMWEVQVCEAILNCFHLQVISLDATSGGLCVSVCTANKLQIWDTRQGLLRVSQDSCLCGKVWSCYRF